MAAKLSLSEAIQVMSNANLKVPVTLKVRALDEEISKKGTVIQVWICKKCPGWRYEAPIRALEVTCVKGHFASVVWDVKNSTLAGT